jgi:hypothetical protein
MGRNQKNETVSYNGKQKIYRLGEKLKSHETVPECTMYIV